jgi:hypothetical protein
MVITAGTLGMHQVEIKVFHTTICQLGIQAGFNILFAFKKVVGKFIRKYIRFPGITGSQAFAQSDLTLAVKVDTGCIKIVKSVFHKCVDHFPEFIMIHIISLGLHPHTTKAKVLFNFRKPIFHGNPTFLFYYISFYAKMQTKPFERLTGQNRYGTMNLLFL